MAVAKSYSTDLERIKKNINNSYTYFYQNYERYHLFRKYCFESTLTDFQLSNLEAQGKPTIECNILEWRVSRLLGEFSKQEPSIEITPADGRQYDPEMINFLTDHLRHLIYESNRNACWYEVYRDILTGGFSVARLRTKYATPMSMDQVLDVDKTLDPTLCGFDPLARYPHKGDGKYSFECYPLLKEEFEDQYTKSDVSTLSFARNVGNFSWSYKTGSNDIVMVCEYFEKQKKKEKIVKLSNNRVMTDKKYQELSAIWNQEGFIEQIPVVVGKPRVTEIDVIYRYKLIENEILQCSKTDFSYLPHVFFDGNSIPLRNSPDSETVQFTRPYIFQAKGVQDLVNYDLQCLGNFYEDMISSKWIIKKEAIPQEKEYIEAITNPQQASTIVVQAFVENDPDKPIPEPIREVIPTNAPQEVLAGFKIISDLVDQSLGSFDTSLGRNNNDLTGIAMIEAITQSNSAAMPYVNRYTQSLEHLANMCVSMFPKYYVSPRTIPVIGMDGKRSYKEINQNGKKTFDYDDYSLNVKIKAGVNFQIEKNRALMQLLMLMKASPQFEAFMNDIGLSVLVKNMTIYGAEELLSLIPEWEEKKKEMEQKASQMKQMEMQNDPRFMDAKTKQMKVIQDAKQNEIDNQIKIAEVAIDKQRADTDSILAQHEATQAQVNSAVQREKAQAEIISHSLDSAAKMASIKHQERMDHHESHRKNVELKHKMTIEKQTNSDDKS